MKNPSIRLFLQCQSFSALGPSGPNHPSAARGGHSFEKSMLSGSFSIAWLKCTFHKIKILKLNVIITLGLFH
jgi:hypothetical protein